MASMGGKGDTLALWLPKEMGSEKAFPKGEALGFYPPQSAWRRTAPPPGGSQAPHPPRFCGAPSPSGGRFRPSGEA